MSKLGKLKDIFRIGSAVAKPFVPGAAGTILDVVNKELEKRGPTNAEPAVQALAKSNDEQEARLNEHEAAILALHERMKAKGI